MRHHGLRIYENGLLGYKEPSITKLFMGSDSEENYNKNLQVKPKDWYYRNCQLSYIYNSNGHRCNDIDKIDLNNYILFAGDSRVEGIGLELEKTFPYLVAEKLGLSYYNLGLGGTGIDYMLYNILTWISKYPKPRYIFMYWSDPTRFLKMDEGSNKILYQVGAHNTVIKDDIQILVHGDAGGYFKTKTWLASNLLKNVLDNNQIPFYNFYNGSAKTHNFNPLIAISNIPIDQARDIHPGIETHKATSSLLIEKYLNKYNNATIYPTFGGEI